MTSTTEQQKQITNKFLAVYFRPNEMAPVRGGLNMFINYYMNELPAFAAYCGYNGYLDVAYESLINWLTSFFNTHIQRFRKQPGIDLTEPYASIMEILKLEIH
jgi:hypothetical protein